MKDKLLKLLENSYSPYYNFPVAAIVVTSDGNEFGGVNVENANGTSICAERNAIATAVSYGYKKGDFKKIYVMALKSDNIVPCFACRQVILEFFSLNDIVVSMNRDGSFTEYLISELCPHAFTGENL